MKNKNKKLKTVNDVCGHKAGDVYIQSFVDVLMDICEKYELKIPTRWGGDEFVLYPLLKSKDIFEIINQEIKKNFSEKELIFNEKSYFGSVSIGMCIVEKNNELNLKEIMRMADEEMYKDKKIYHDMLK